LSCFFASADQNEKKHSLTILDKAKQVLKNSGAKLRSVIADSFLKTQYSMAINKVRGLGNVAAYALFSILCVVLNREAAENIGRKDKAVSPTYFNT
jgi:hypothetical protein